MDDEIRDQDLPDPSQDSQQPEASQQVNPPSTCSSKMPCESLDQPAIPSSSLVTSSPAGMNCSELSKFLESNGIPEILVTPFRGN